MLIHIRHRASPSTEHAHGQILSLSVCHIHCISHHLVCLFKTLATCCCECTLGGVLFLSRDLPCVTWSVLHSLTAAFSSAPDVAFMLTVEERLTRIITAKPTLLPTHVTVATTRSVVRPHINRLSTCTISGVPTLRNKQQYRQRHILLLQVNTHNSSIN